MKFKIKISLSSKVDRMKTAPPYFSLQLIKVRLIRVMFSPIIAILLMNMPPSPPFVELQLMNATFLPFSPPSPSSLKFVKLERNNSTVIKLSSHLSYSQRSDKVL